MHRHFRLPALAALFLTGAFSVWAADTPVKGGTLIYLEQQPHTNLYPPAGGFYPNGGILNQITDKLTWQNPKTLEIEPWIAESWTSNADKTEYTFHLRKGVTFSDGTPLDAAAVAKNFDTYGLGDKAHRLPVSEVINNYQRSEVIDPLTVKFYFNKPSPGFLQGTATIGSGVRRVLDPSLLHRSNPQHGLPFPQSVSSPPDEGPHPLAHRETHSGYPAHRSGPHKYRRPLREENLPAKVTHCNNPAQPQCCSDRPLL